MTRHRLRQRSGFTLIELILALLICAMLATTMYTAMAITQRARRSATESVNRARAITIAAEILRQDFESVPPPTGDFAESFVGIKGAGALGTGDADQIEFFTIGRDEAVQAVDDPFAEGIRKVALLVRTDTGAEAPVLVRRVTRNLRPSVEARVEEETIARDVRSFSVHYWDGLSWQDNWDSTTVENTLPMAVAITLELTDRSTGREDQVRRVSRVFPLSCGKPVDPLAGFGG